MVYETYVSTKLNAYRGAIRVARSMIPGSREDVDRTIEETIMRDSKAHSGATGTGISGITRNYAAYQHWISAMHEIEVYSCNIFTCRHGILYWRSRQGCKKIRGEKNPDNASKTVDAFKNFLNLFSVEKDKLYCVASAAAVPPEIEKDLLEAEKKGKEARVEFVDERLKKGEQFLSPYVSRS